MGRHASFSRPVPADRPPGPFHAAARGVRLPADTDIVRTKAALRAAALARRDALDPAARDEGSRLIGLALRRMVPDGAAVSAFLPIRSEVDLGPLVRDLAATGHRVGLPVIRGAGLVFRAFDAAAPLVPRGFGTLGPPDDAAEVEPEVMLVPVAAFDRSLGRIGYGKAYYDTAIAALRASGRNPLLLGVAFSVQEVDRVPMEPHDVPLHRVVTEAGAIPAPAGGGR